MRHLVGHRKLGLPSDQRRALLHGLTQQLFIHEAIRTTDTRAKEVRSIAEEIITLAKRNDLHSRRLARRILKSESLVKRVFDEIAPRYASRNGGYTRMVRLGHRRGDGAMLVLLELIQ